jgi:hypothetical protein
MVVSWSVPAMELLAILPQQDARRDRHESNIWNQSPATMSGASQTGYTNSGGRDSRTFHLYNYTFALNNAKTVQSVVLPTNANVEVLAMTAVP